MIKNVIFLKFIKNYLDRFFEVKPNEFQPYILNSKYLIYMFESKIIPANFKFF